MGSFAGRLLLESGVIPFIVTLLGISTARYVDGVKRRSLLASTVMIPASVGATYLLVMGWPNGIAIDARIKIVLASFAGAIIGLGLHRNQSAAKAGAIALSIALPLWVGLPALQQARPESGFLLLPVLVGVLLSIAVQPSQSALTQRRLIILMTLAFGLAAIAAFARTLSYAELAFALASALIAVFFFGRNIDLSPILSSAASMMLALTTALLLYTDASRAALVVLSTVLLSEAANRLLGERFSRPVTALIFPLACLLPLCIAVMIARVDAGPFSHY
jgi:hypothetical protein